MRDLHYYITNPFNSLRISLVKLVAFTTDHIQRMRGHNDSGIFTERIAATAAALADLRHATLNDDVQRGIRRGVKLAKKQFRAALPDALRPIYGAVLTAFNDPSEEMRTVFPGGRSIFYETRDDRLDVALDGLVEKLTALESAPMAEAIAQAEALHDKWRVIHRESVAASAAKRLAEADQREARHHLQFELFVNLSLIQTLIPDKPEDLRLYMQMSLLTKQRRRPSESDTAAGTDTLELEETLSA